MESTMAFVMGDMLMASQKDWRMVLVMEMTLME
jgi:hypothetical protein